MSADDDLLTLDEACTQLLRGLVKPATLRAAAGRGELVLERLGRRDFVTARAVRDWRHACRRLGSQRDSGSAPPAPTAPLPGSSSTADASTPQDAALRIAQALKEHCTGTSPQRPSSRPARVIPITSRSQQP